MKWIINVLTWVVASGAFADIPEAKKLEGKRPNIVLVMPDDNSFDTISRYGGSAISPHLDKLYDQAVRLNRFHVSPTCAPSRASIMTGRNAFYAGVTHTILGRDRMNPEQTTIAQMLQQAGYTTGLFGKWHLGDSKKFRPSQRGFDEVWQHGAGGIGQFYPNSCDFPANTYHDPVLLHNEVPKKTQGYCTDIYFDKAIGWIKECQDSEKPFFAFITPNAPHSPLIPPKGYDERMPDATEYDKMQANIDDNVGKIIAFLDSSGLRKDTLFIFHTDNGRRKQRVHGTLLKGSKGTASEGGLWVPCVVSWPGTLPENVDRGELCGHIDWFMTFAALAGSDFDMPGNKPWDGRNLLPVICGEADATWDNRLFIAHRGRWRKGTPTQSKYKECSIQNGQFKLYNNTELYDMKLDRSESTNLATQHPDVVKSLQNEYDRFWDDVLPFMINDANPQAAEELENEPFHKEYHTAFGAEKYEEKLKRIAYWQSIKKGKGGQPLEDYYMETK